MWRRFDEKHAKCVVILTQSPMRLNWILFAPRQHTIFFSKFKLTIALTIRSVRPDRIYPRIGLDHPKNVSENRFLFELVQEPILFFGNQLELVRFPIPSEDQSRPILELVFSLS